MYTHTLRGQLQVPGDKSISHRALMFALLAEGACNISRLSPAADCQSTIGCLRQLGLEITPDGADAYVVKSLGLDALRQPTETLDAGNSGTTIRLLSGILAGRELECQLDGDDSLRSRPMGRVLNAMKEMGARIHYNVKDNHAPFTINGGNLTGKEFTLPVASAQVQTAIVLAGLQADGVTSVELPALVRDHTERMFQHLGVPYKPFGKFGISVQRLEGSVKPFALEVPGDISSAAFFMVAAACTPGSELTLPNVGLNEGRTLVLDVLREMGADITVVYAQQDGGEPVGTLVIRGGKQLTGATIGGDRIARGIDEIPALALAGALCNGKLTVQDAQELRVKESDRLEAICSNLKLSGASVTELPDGFILEGKRILQGGSLWKTHHDHRLAMTGLVASSLFKEPVIVDNLDCIAVSYPHFDKDYERLFA